MGSLSGAISIACLIVTGALCSWAIFSKHFDDSLVQRIGLALVAAACVLRIPAKLANPETPPELLAAQLGLVIYGVGTVLRIWRDGRGQRERQRGDYHYNPVRRRSLY